MTNGAGLAVAARFLGGAMAVAALVYGAIRMAELGWERCAASLVAGAILAAINL